MKNFQFWFYASLRIEVDYLKQDEKVAISSIQVEMDRPLALVSQNR